MEKKVIFTFVICFTMFLSILINMLSLKVDAQMHSHNQFQKHKTC
jgi:hypothetical protein